MKTGSGTSIIRIGGTLLLISATVFGWIALSHRGETKFWNIGSYTIASVSAQDDEEDDDRSSRGSREGDDNNNDYTLTEATPVITPTTTGDDTATLPEFTTLQQQDLAAPAKVTNTATPTTTRVTQTKVIVQQPVVPSFDERAQSMLGSIGFSENETQVIIGQFQGLYRDIVTKYPTTLGQVEILQKLINEANTKITDLQFLSSANSPEVFSAKKKSLQALQALAGIRISMLQIQDLVSTASPAKTTGVVTTSIPPRNTTTPQAVIVTPVVPKKTPVVTTPVATPKTITTPVAPKPVPAKVVTPVVTKPAPVVNTRTRAS